MGGEGGRGRRGGENRYREGMSDGKGVTRREREKVGGSNGG